MISADGVKRYCDSIYAAGAVYVWGADVEVITEDMIKEKMNKFGKGHYTNIDIGNVVGRLGADCSGFLTPIAGIDRTAESHYKTCPAKGKSSDLPLDKVCLLFREEAGRVVHVAIYTGDGMLYEMWDGCEYRRFKPSEWTYYGIPAWIEEQKSVLKAGDTVTISAPISIYNTASDAKRKKNALPYQYKAGTYYVHKTHEATGAVNITKTKGVAGAWVIP